VTEKLNSIVETLVKKMDVDLVGFAPVERFKHAPEDAHPQYYMPQAESVIVLGAAMPRSINDIFGTFEEPHKTAGPYMWYGYGYLNWFLSSVAYRTAKFLQKRGYAALPFPPTWPLASYRKADLLFRGDPKFVSDLSSRHAAVAAGLGEFGWSGLVLTPQFGPRQRFVTIVTDAPFEPSPMYDGPPLCDRELCKDLCIKACSDVVKAYALDATKFKECKIDSKTYKYAMFYPIRCRYAQFGLIRGAGARANVVLPTLEELPGDVPVEGFYKAASSIRTHEDHGMNQPTHVSFCGRCIHACPSPDLKPGYMDEYFKRKSQ